MLSNKSILEHSISQNPSSTSHDSKGNEIVWDASFIVKCGNFSSHCSFSFVVNFIICLKIESRFKSNEHFNMYLSINRRWHLSTTPNTTKKCCTLFKLIQPSDMVALRAEKPREEKSKFEPEKKSSVYYWKLSFQATNFSKSPFSVINWTFFPQVRFSSQGNSEQPY